jgi:hypothetical protein
MVNTKEGVARRPDLRKNLPPKIQRHPDFDFMRFCENRLFQNVIPLTNNAEPMQTINLGADHRLS